MPLHISGIFQCYKCKASRDFGKDFEMPLNCEFKCPMCGTVLIQGCPSTSKNKNNKKEKTRK